jgi:hypothetical protein
VSQPAAISGLCLCQVCCLSLPCCCTSLPSASLACLLVCRVCAAVGACVSVCECARTTLFCLVYTQFPTLHLSPHMLDMSDAQQLAGQVPSSTHQGRRDVAQERITRARFPENVCPSVLLDGVARGPYRDSAEERGSWPGIGVERGTVTWGLWVRSKARILHSRWYHFPHACA